MRWRIWRFLAVSALSNGLGYCAYLLIVRLGAGRHAISRKPNS